VKVSAGFDVATTKVEPDVGDVTKAASAHREVRSVLEADDLLKDWGIDSVLIGSYRRQVSIRRIKDVDVFCRLPNIPGDVTGEEALTEIKRVLVAEYGAQAVKPQARSLKVEIDAWDGLHVDAVPARPAGPYWEIPDHDKPGCSWQKTNPEEMTRLKTEMNERMGVLYVPGVKLLRQTRRAIGVPRHPGGLYIEMALYRACDLGYVSGDDLRTFYVSALNGVATVTTSKVTYGFEIPDPSMLNKNLAFRATDDQWEAAEQKLRDAAAEATRALNETRCMEAAIFHRLLGTNSDDNWVYPLPDDCNVNGTTKSQIQVGDRSARGGNQRFA
jgi:Second Messenger Oligonucleotide or Dinucleotide Synthetase domain